MMLAPSDPRVPKFWMYETSGVLRPVVERYLHGKKLSPLEIATMKAYLGQWVSSPVWAGGPELSALLAAIDMLRTRQDIDSWLEKALDLGMDPL